VDRSNRKIWDFIERFDFDDVRTENEYYDKLEELRERHEKEDKDKKFNVNFMGFLKSKLDDWNVGDSEVVKKMIDMGVRDSKFNLLRSLNGFKPGDFITRGDSSTISKNHDYSDEL